MLSYCFPTWKAIINGFTRVLFGPTTVGSCLLHTVEESHISSYLFGHSEAAEQFKILAARADEKIERHLNQNYLAEDASRLVAGS